MKFNVFIWNVQCWGHYKSGVPITRQGNISLFLLLLYSASLLLVAINVKFYFPSGVVVVKTMDILARLESCLTLLSTVWIWYFILYFVWNIYQIYKRRSGEREVHFLPEAERFASFLYAESRNVHTFWKGARHWLGLEEFNGVICLMFIVCILV